VADDSARASSEGALARFASLSRLLCFVLVLHGGGAAAAECGVDRVDAEVTVDRVYDGDTVRLNDGRHLRLIGLDTPELGRDGAADQPLAAAARDALRQRLGAAAVLTLRYDAETRDVHGRSLAHAFFADGSSVAAWLLEQGLATLLIVPPDVWNAACYAAAERRARAAGRGLWALADHQPTVTTALHDGASGYRVLRGQVKRVHEAACAVWLDLAGGVALRIDREDLPYFAGVPWPELAGQEVIVRGWAYPVGGEIHIKLRHPANLEWSLPK